MKIGTLVLPKIIAPARAKACHGTRVLLRVMSLESRCAGCRQQAGRLETVLDGDRQAFERSRRALRNARVALLRRPVSGSKIDLNDRVQGRINAFNSRDGGSEQFLRGYFALQELRVQRRGGI